MLKKFLINHLYEYSMGVDREPDETNLNFLLNEDEDAPEDEVREWLLAPGRDHEFSVESYYSQMCGERYTRLVLTFKNDNTALHFRFRFAYPFADDIREESGFSEHEDSVLNEMAEVLVTEMNQRLPKPQLNSSVFEKLR